jgi:hypothetical protein
VGETVYKTLEIPTTLPTWDEALADPAISGPEALIASYRRAIRATEVHTLHTEVEGSAHLSIFSKQLDAWQADGVRFLTLEEYAREIVGHSSRIPLRAPTRITLPYRGGFVSSSSPLKINLASV